VKPTRDYRLGFEWARTEAIAALMCERRTATDKEARLALGRLLVALADLEIPKDTAALDVAGGSDAE
jgi:hypothetical protein